MIASDIVGSKTGTYAKLVPDNATKQKIAEIIDMINVENPLGPDDLHVTIVYSRKECHEIKDIHVDMPVTARGLSFDLFGPEGDAQCLVLKLHSDAIRDLHNTCRDQYGASHDYPEYNPHITLSYDYPHEQVPNESLLEYFTNLRFDQYIVEPLNLD